MPYLFGDRISDAERAELLARLNARGTPEAVDAADTIRLGAGRESTAASGLRAREAIVKELLEWDDLGQSAPGLVAVRDRLSANKQGRRII